MDTLGGTGDAHEVKDFVLLIVPSCAAQHLEQLGVVIDCYPIQTACLKYSRSARQVAL